MRHALLAVAALGAVVLALLAPATGATPAAADGTRTVVLENDVSIEKVAGDGLPPFDRPEQGEAVFFRVKATSNGPGVARRGELLVVADVRSENAPTVRGRNGVARCETRRGLDGNWVVACQSTRVLRDGGSLSVLLRVEAGERRIVVEGGGLKSPTAGKDLAVRSKDDRAAIKVAEPGPRWTGVWTWRATWPGGSFTGHGMTIRQSGATACATWPWSQGSGAKGPVASDGVWSASWEDDYGDGTWILVLHSDGVSFSGTQVIDSHAPGVPTVTATISGTRTAGPGAVTLACSTITVRP